MGGASWGSLFPARSSVAEIGNSFVGGASSCGRCQATDVEFWRGRRRPGHARRSGERRDAGKRQHESGRNGSDDEQAYPPLTLPEIVDEGCTWACGAGVAALGSRGNRRRRPRSRGRRDRGFEPYRGGEVLQEARQLSIVGRQGFETRAQRSGKFDLVRSAPCPRHICLDPREGIRFVGSQRFAAIAAKFNRSEGRRAPGGRDGCDPSSPSKGVAEPIMGLLHVTQRTGFPARHHTPRFPRHKVAR